MSFAICSRTCLNEGSSARIDGEVVRLADAPSLDRQMRHNIEIVVDRLVAAPDNRTRVAEAVEAALSAGDGNLILAVEQEPASGRRKRGWGRA